MISRTRSQSRATTAGLDVLPLPGKATKAQVQQCFDRFEEILRDREHKTTEIYTEVSNLWNQLLTLYELAPPNELPDPFATWIVGQISLERLESYMSIELEKVLRECPYPNKLRTTARNLQTSMPLLGLYFGPRIYSVLLWRQCLDSWSDQTNPDIDTIYPYILQARANRLMKSRDQTRNSRRRTFGFKGLDTTEDFMPADFRQAAQACRLPVVLAVPLPGALEAC